MSENEKKHGENPQDQMTLAEIEKVHPEIKKLSHNEKKAVLEIVQSFSGPIPPPAWIAEYGKIDSSFPERIMKMAEKEQANRHYVNVSVLRLAKTAQILTAILAAMMTVVGGLALFWGYSTCAVIIFGITIGALLAAYLQKDKENKGK